MSDKDTHSLQAILDANPQIEWNRIKGFRNLVAHDYFGIDAEEVWQIISNDLSIFKVKIEEIELD